MYDQNIFCLYIFPFGVFPLLLFLFVCLFFFAFNFKFNYKITKNTAIITGTLSVNSRNKLLKAVCVKA